MNLSIVVAHIIVICLVLTNATPVRNQNTRQQPFGQRSGIFDIRELDVVLEEEQKDDDDKGRVFFDYYDARQSGEHTCDPKSYRETVYGIGLMAHSWNPMDPVQTMGDFVVNFTLVPSGDCSTWVPVGFNVQRTKTSNAGVQIEESSSLTKTKDTRAFKATASIGGAASSFSASVETSLTSSSELESSVQEKQRHYATWIESVDSTVSFSRRNPPVLDTDFARRLSEYNQTTDKDGFVLALLADYSHYLFRAELGSRLSEI